jgi:cobalamin biosynthesis Mg chelatase CobN
MCSDPEDKQIQRELRALKALIREEKAESAKTFKGAFGAPPKPKPSSGADPNPSSSGNEDGAAAVAAAAAGGAAEIDEAAATGGQPGKAAAASSSRSSHSQVVVAAVVLLIAALLAFMFGWLPGTGA